MNQDEKEGKKKNMQGRVKEAVGTLTGNEDLETEGAEETGRRRGAGKDRKGKPQAGRSDRGSGSKDQEIDRRPGGASSRG